MIITKPRFGRGIHAVWAALGLGLLLAAGVGCAQRPVQGDNSPTPAPTLTSIVIAASTQPTPAASYSPTPAVTRTPSATPTLTLTPTLPPTLTPTINPVAVDRLAVIGLENAHRLTRLAVIPPAAPISGLAGGFALAPNGQTVAVGRGLTVGLWDIAAGQVSRELVPPPQTQNLGGALAYSADGAWLARIYGLNQIVVWAVKTGDVAQTLTGGPDSAFTRLAFAGSGGNLHLAAAGVAGGQPGLIFWDVASGDRLAESPSGAVEVGSLVISPNGRMAVQAGRDGVVRFWDPLAGKRTAQQILYACPDALLGAAFNFSGGILALACEPASEQQAPLRIFFYAPNYFRPDNMGLYQVIPSDRPGNGLMAFGVESTLLAVVTGSPESGRQADQLSLLGYYTRKPAVVLDFAGHEIRQVEFARTGRLLAVGLDDGQVALWGIQ